MRTLRNVLLSVLSTLTFCSCGRSSTFHGIDVFMDTKVWTLAILVDLQDTVLMRKYVELHPEINIDEEAPLFGSTLLEWAIFNSHYRSFEQLLKLGANPNHISSIDRNTPLMFAVFHTDAFHDEGIPYLIKLFEFGADANLIAYCPGGRYDTTALNVAASRYSLNYVKCLIENGGANPYLKPDGISPLQEAVQFERLDIAYYLISKFRLPLKTKRGPQNTEDQRTIYDMLHQKDFTHDSTQYELQQKILKYSDEHEK